MQDICVLASIFSSRLFCCFEFALFLFPDTLDKVPIRSFFHCYYSWFLCYESFWLFWRNLYFLPRFSSFFLFLSLWYFIEIMTCEIFNCSIFKLAVFVNSTADPSFLSVKFWFSWTSKDSTPVLYRLVAISYSLVGWQFFERPVFCLYGRVTPCLWLGMAFVQFLILEPFCLFFSFISHCHFSLETFYSTSNAICELMIKLGHLF